MKFGEAVVGGLLFLVTLGFLASVIAIVAVVGTDAFKEWKKHNWRFGLRAVLIATALIGALLWVVLFAGR